MPDGFDIAAEEQPASEDESEVLQGMMSLPEKYRSVLHLYYYEEYTTKEIAGILNKKEATVRSLLKRGREKLAEKLGRMKDGSSYKNLEKGV